MESGVSVILKGCRNNDIPFSVLQYDTGVLKLSLKVTYLRQ